MGENTKIEWAHHTFNPWVGCAKVGPGCDNCYAEDWAKRCGMVQWGPNAERRRTSERNWLQPIKWNAQAQRLGVRYRVFCSSLADVFDNAVPDAWRADLFKLIAATPHLDWMLLTKRIGNLQALIIKTGDELRLTRPFDAGGCSHDVAEGMCNAWESGHPPRNVWIGATICNQEEADRDIPKLLDVHAEKRFLSIEPMLGPISLIVPFDGAKVNAAIGARPGIPALDWVIAGGESGPKARPMHPDWARSLRDQCASAEVAFFMKQLSGDRGKVINEMSMLPEDLRIMEYPNSDGKDA